MNEPTKIKTNLEYLRKLFIMTEGIQRTPY